MHQGNWKCSTCGGAITELPFEPRSEAGLTCKDCYIKQKNGGASGGAGASAPASDVATGVGADMDDREVPDFDPEGASSASEPAPESPEMSTAPTAEKKMFSGDWKCAGCSNSISELPFEPRNTDNLKCRDCFMKEKSG